MIVTETNGEGGERKKKKGKRDSKRRIPGTRVHDTQPECDRNCQEAKRGRGLSFFCPSALLPQSSVESLPQASLVTPHEAVHGGCTLPVQGLPCLQWEGLQPCGLLRKCEALATLPLSAPFRRNHPPINRSGGQAGRSGVGCSVVYVVGVWCLVFGVRCAGRYLTLGRQTAESYADGSHMAVSPFLRTFISRPQILVLDAPGAPYHRHQQDASSYVFSSSFLQVFACPSPLRSMPTLFPRPTRAPLQTSPHLVRLCLPRQIHVPPSPRPIWEARGLRTGTALRRDPDQLMLAGVTSPLGHDGEAHPKIGRQGSFTPRPHLIIGSSSRETAKGARFDNEQGLGNVARVSSISQGQITQNYTPRSNAATSDVTWVTATQAVWTHPLEQGLDRTHLGAAQGPRCENAPPPQTAPL